MSSLLRGAWLMAIPFLITTVGAQEMPKSQPPLWSAKPDVAAFETMENDRLAAAQRAIDRVLAVKASHTIENTLAPYDEAFQQLNAADSFSDLMQQVHPDKAFRDHATAMNTKVSSAATALSLNRDVFLALASLDLSGTDPATRYYVQRLLLEFRLAGVNKDDTTRTKIRGLQDELAGYKSMFDRNISDDVRSVELTDASELDGLPEDYINNHKPASDGKIHITTNYPDVFPALTFAKSDRLRHSLSEAFFSRAYPKNREVLTNMMRTRYEIASLLGYSSWADYNAADKMVGSGANIAKFIEQLDRALRPAAKREFAMALTEKQKTDPGAKEIEIHEVFYLPELVRRSQYDFDSETVRPYLPYTQVQKGIMDTAATLFHVTFRQELKAPGWDASVEVWDVIESGRAIGRFYLDMHPRPGKYSHAEMVPLLDGLRGRQLPEAALVCNFPAPTAADPGLLAYDDVRSFFHEFGHLMHHLLGGQQRWAGISGTNVERDFVEAPSQMLEEWMRSPQVLASFARHYKTGEPIPSEMVARMNRASAFGRAGDLTSHNAFTAISYEIYRDKPEMIDLDALVLSDFRRYTLATPTAAIVHFYASFGHLSGYSSSYYTYMWDKVIAEDFFQQFDQKNLLAGEAPMRYRRTVLEPGGSMSANDLINNFLGRPQNMVAFQRWIGEEFESTPQDNAPARP